MEKFAQALLIAQLWALERLMLTSSYSWSPQHRAWRDSCWSWAANLGVCKHTLGSNLLFHRFLGFLCFGGICWRGCSGFHVNKGLPSGMEWPCGQRPLHLKLNSLLLTISFSPQSSFAPDLGFSTVAPLLRSGRKNMEPCVERWTCRHRPVETQHVLYFS